MKRIYTLDYLRGFAALLILIYHYLTWSGYDFGAETALRRVGFYGVTIFYMLSGLTLFYVYEGRLEINKVSLKAFFLKRAARILPLLCCVSLIAIVLSRKIPNLFDVFLNFSGLFGFFKWNTYFATGAWSIGNELVFYVFFPFLLVAARNKSLIFWIIGAIIFVISIYFSFFKLPEVMEENKLLWRNYVNPLNQLIYFFSGVAIGKLFCSIKNVSNNLLYIILLLAVLLFLFYPTDVQDFCLIMGSNRYVFSLSCWLIVVCLFLLKLDNSNFYHKPLLFLGEISYGLYLFHPIVFTILKKALRISGTTVPPFLFLLLSAILSILVSFISYQYFEKRIVKFVNGFLKN